MSEHIREIRVRVYIDTNKRTIDQTYEPREDETLTDLLKRIAEEYEEGIL